MTKLPFKIQERKIYYAKNIGAGNSYLLMLSGYEKYEYFDAIKFIATHSNLGPSKVRVGDLDWIPIKKFMQKELIKGDIIEGCEVYMTYLKDHFLILDIVLPSDMLKKAA